jgi:2-methylcitrate dehydratase
MEKTTVMDDGELTAIFPESSPSRITIRLTDGNVIRNDLRYPKGHAMAPLSDPEVEKKFAWLFSGYRDAEGAARVIELVNRLENMADIGDLFAAFARGN